MLFFLHILAPQSNGVLKADDKVGTGVILVEYIYICNGDFFLWCLQSLNMNSAIEFIGTHLLGTSQSFNVKGL